MLRDLNESKCSNGTAYASVKNFRSSGIRPTLKATECDVKRGHTRQECRSADELREVISPAEFCSVTFGRSEEDCELHLRPDESAAALECTEWNEHLAIYAVVVDRDNAADEVSFQALSKIIHDVGAGRIEMSVQIEEPWHKDLAGCVKYAGALGNLCFGRDGKDPVALENYRLQTRRCSCAIDDASADNGRCGLRFCDRSG
jgi:hypothetical protein